MDCVLGCAECRVVAGRGVAGCVKDDRKRASTLP